jgi:hypothetical protein
MKLYNKKSLYTNEGGIFKRTKKVLYIPTKQGKIVGLSVLAVASIVALGILISFL